MTKAKTKKVDVEKVTKAITELVQQFRINHRENEEGVGWEDFNQFFVELKWFIENKI